MATPSPPAPGAVPSVSSSSKEAKETAERAKLYTERHVPSFGSQCFLLEKAEEIYLEPSMASQPGTPVDGRSMPVRQIGIRLPPKSKFKSVHTYKTNLNYIQYLTRLKQEYFRKYFNFTPDQIARISHYVRIRERFDTRGPKSKTTYAPIFKEKSQKEFYSDGLLSSRSRRLGAGIRSVDVDFDGVDSFTKKQVVVKASFIFQDIKEMMSSPYDKLFVLETDRDGKLRTIEFKLGWKSEDKDLKAAVENLDLTIRATLFKYDFDVRQDGSIVADAMYRGQYVDTFNGPGSNVLEIAKNRYKQIKDQLDEIEKTKAQIVSQSTKNASEAQEQLQVLENYITAADLTRDEIAAGSSTSLSATATTSSGVKAKNRIREIALNRVEASYKAGGFTTAAIKSKKGKASSIYNSIYKSVGDVPTTTTKTLEDYINELKQQAVLKKSLITTNKSNATNAALYASKYATDAQLRKANLGKLLALQIIGDNLISTDRIKYALIDREVIKQFKLASSIGDRSGVAAVLDGLSAGDYVKNKSAYDAVMNKEAIDSTQYQVIPFIYLGEFIDSILRVPVDFNKDASGKMVPNKKETVYDLMKKEGSDFRVDLGFVSYNTPFSSNRISSLPMYYLPISLLEINNFFVREVIAKGKSFYSFNDLILDVIKRFLTGVFSSCAKEANTQSFSPPKVATVLGERKENKKKVTQFFIYGAKNVIADLEGKGLNSAKNFGRYGKNLAASVPHFYLFGRNKGIEKSIKISDNADDTIKTAVYYSQRSSLVSELDGGNAMKFTGFMPAVFTADIQTIGFPLMSLGQLIYLDLKSQLTEKKENSRPFKASGYYNVHKVSHSFTVDTFSTNISAIIQVPYVNRKNLVISDKVKRTSADASGYKKATSLVVGGTGGATFTTTLAKVKGGTTPISIDLGKSDFKVKPTKVTSPPSAADLVKDDKAIFETARTSSPMDFTSLVGDYRPDSAKTISALKADMGTDVYNARSNLSSLSPYSSLDPRVIELIKKDIEETHKTNPALLNQRLYYIYIYDDGTSDVIVEVIYN
jgi:hypothetical protein